MMNTNASDDRQLIELARDLEWGAVVERAQSHPEEIDLVDHSANCSARSRGSTVFHYICRYGAPLFVLQLLMQIDKRRHSQNPKERSILRVTRCGMTPLMVACEKRHVSLVRELVDRVPELIPMANARRETAGHYVMTKLQRHDLFNTLDMAEMLLHQDPESRHAVTDYGATMASLLLGFMNKNFTEYVLKYPEQGGSSLFRKLFHCCIYGVTSEPSKTSPLLHRFLQFREFPFRYLQRALELRPTLINEKDVDGNTPLHVAASSFFPSKGVTKCQSTAPTCNMGLLLEMKPSAARERNKDGFLPLQLASGICTPLLDAYPAAVESFHLEDGVYPLILEKAGMNASTVFQLLTAKPELANWAQ